MICLSPALVSVAIAPEQPISFLLYLRSNYLDAQQECREYIKSKRPIPLRAVHAYFYVSGNFEKQLQSGRNPLVRSLPSWEHLSPLPDARNILEAALNTGSIQGDISGNVGLRHCYKRGWLQAIVAEEGQQVTYVYPTMVHLMSVLQFTLSLSYLSCKKHPPDGVTFWQ
jgi:hypothetical protein